jgi:hypothetical protein
VAKPDEAHERADRPKATIDPKAAARMMQMKCNNEYDHNDDDRRQTTDDSTYLVCLLSSRFVSQVGFMSKHSCKRPKLGLQAVVNRINTQQSIAKFLNAVLAWLRYRIVRGGSKS